MEPISLDDVADILDLSSHRIEQWISRGKFLLKNTGARGVKREWDLSEVIRLAVFARLATDLGLRPVEGRFLSLDEADSAAADEARRLTQTGVHGFWDDEAFFVCYKTEPDFGWSHDIVRKSLLGEFLANGCSVVSLNPKNDKGPADVAIVINLDQIERKVKAGWPT
ncbi:hypothetical protein [Rhizobium sp. BK176]|uniref:hypothetical protein n=1 Tax=Rhizobium sp. BK176 TaxID=2587071 RepID=UPI002166CA18|nr:hypothetical protein [Rhizobium sp. BK176]MCS4089783.1 hypothetical protein [Rhizobium sp. BK176]